MKKTGMTTTGTTRTCCFGVPNPPPSTCHPACLPACLCARRPCWGVHGSLVGCAKGGQRHFRWLAALCFGCLGPRSGGPGGV